MLLFFYQPFFVSHEFTIFMNTSKKKKKLSNVSNQVLIEMYDIFYPIFIFYFYFYIGKLYFTILDYHPLYNLPSKLYISVMNSLLY